VHHTSASRGRGILAIGAVIVVGSCFLPWWQIGGDLGQLTRQSGNGFSAVVPGGFPMFLAALATLLLITLPFASERPMGIDHPVSYLALLGVIAISYAWCVLALAQKGLVPFPPQLGPGFWTAALGILVMARGVFEFYEEYGRRLY
jgi:hypothetical protein